MHPTTKKRRPLRHVVYFDYQFRGRFRYRSFTAGGDPLCLVNVRLPGA